jgi:hypothetical protein
MLSCPRRPQQKFANITFLLKFGKLSERVSESSRLLPRDIKSSIHRTIILPLVSYGCETRSQTLRTEHGLGVFGNTVLRRIFGLKKGGIIGGC